MRYLYIIIAILLAINNVFIRFKIGDISYDRLLEFVIFFFLFKSYLNELKINPFFKKWNNFIMLFAILQLLMNLGLAISGKLEFNIVYIGLFKCFSFLVYSFLFLLIAKKDLKLINIIVYIHFAICVFAFLQHPMSPIASQMLELKKSLFSSGLDDAVLRKLGNEEGYIEGGHGDKFRLAGPFLSTISFSYFAISSFIINFYMYLRYNKKIYLFFLVVLFIASILSQTRSLLLALILLVFGYLFFAPFKRHGFYKLAIVTGMFIAIFFVYASENLIATGNSRITKVSSGGKGDSRPGLYTVVQNPFGITEKYYTEAKQEMFRKYGNSDILMVSAHNGLINIGFHYSIFGYFLFFFLVLFLLRNINLLEPKFTIFFRLVLLSYLVHTSFHNNFIFNADYPFLMVLMLISVDYYKPMDKFEINKIKEGVN